MVSDALYKRILWGCQCGHVARSAVAEARHRHAFPLLCKKPKVNAVRKRKSDRSTKA